MQVFGPISIIMILFFMYAYFNTTILAITMFPGIHQPKVYYSASEPFTTIPPPTSLEFPWTI